MDSIENIRQIINESLFGKAAAPIRGYMMFSWCSEQDENIDDLYAQTKNHLANVGVNTKLMEIDKASRRMTIVTTDDMASGITDIFLTYGFPCVSVCFDTKNPESPDDYYPEPSDVQEKD